ncbi:MAG: hypothetical protein IT424_12935 [Pirellulales bacterium]|nr:hypothetical protein [Pirellulales bacterium]
MKRNRHVQGIFLIALFALAYSNTASATLKFYYDPLTGNVSFDATEARGGSIRGYGLYIHDSSYAFRTENRLRLSSSTLYINNSKSIDEGTQGDAWSGLYTLGDILPAGIAEQAWTTLFQGYNVRHTYVDLVGQGFPPPAEFLYGRPSGEFQNRLDLIDPNTLTWASEATLIYRARTGEVLLKTNGHNGGYISAVLLTSAHRFLPEGLDPDVELGPLGAASASTIGILVDLIEPGRMSLGSILPAGLSPAAFESLFTRAEFLGRAGFKAQDLDFETQGRPFSLAYSIPEPGSGALLAAIAGLGFVCCRCRLRGSK